MTRELVLPTAPEEVWKALTDPEELEKWFANDVQLDIEQGEGVFRWDDGEVRRASVEELEEGRRFAFTWRDEDDVETRVAFDLEEVPDGTRLTVTESSPDPQASAEWSTALALRFGRMPALVG